MAEPRSVRVSDGPPVTLRTYGSVAPEVSDQALIEQLTAERDRYAVMLLAAEQELARMYGAETHELESCRQECLELESYRQAYLLLVNSRSWRLTKLLRVAARFARTLVNRRTRG